MTGWTPEAVLAASAAWTWVRPGAGQVVTDEHRLVAYPFIDGQPAGSGGCSLAGEDRA